MEWIGKAYHDRGHENQQNITEVLCRNLQSMSLISVWFTQTLTFWCCFTPTLWDLNLTWFSFHMCICFIYEHRITAIVQLLQQASTHTVTHSSLPWQQDGAQNMKNKGKKTHLMEIKSNKKSIHNQSPSLTSRTILIQSLNTIYLGSSLSPSSSTSCVIAEHDVIWHKMSLWRIQISCPNCVLSQSPVHLQPIPCREAG